MEYALAPFFALVFVALWLSIGYLLTRVTAWGTLEDNLADRSNSDTLGKMRFQGAYIGRERMGASYRGCLTYTVTEKGLRISIWRLFAPFAKPVFLPWGEIDAERVRHLTFAMVRFKVGSREKVWITLPRSAAEKIARLSDGRFRLPEEKT